MDHREPSLFQARAGEGGESHDIAGRIDVFYGGLEVLVDGDSAARISCDAGGIKVETAADLVMKLKNEAGVL